MARGEIDGLTFKLYDPVDGSEEFSAWSTWRCGDPTSPALPQAWDANVQHVMLLLAELDGKNETASRLDPFVPLRKSGLFTQPLGNCAIFQTVMHGGNGPNLGRGIVLSDLHLFARRSRAADCLQSLRADLASADVVVLNGDRFDFRWRTLRDRRTTVAAAIDGLRTLVIEFAEVPHSLCPGQS